MDEYVIVEKSSLNSIGDTVRSATGSTENISVNNLNDAVAAAVTSGRVLIDSSLTQSGYAADAKATGDAISNISEEIANLRTSSSGGFLIVTCNPDDSTYSTATHSSSEIYEAFQSGKAVQFYRDGNVFQLIMSTADVAYFSFGGFFGDEAGFMTIGINNNSEINNLGSALVPQLINRGYDSYIELSSIVLYSSTDGSNQKFRITVDDSGTISATNLSGPV